MTDHEEKNLAIANGDLETAKNALATVTARLTAARELATTLAAQFHCRWAAAAEPHPCSGWTLQERSDVPKIWSHVPKVNAAIAEVERLERIAENARLLVERCEHARAALDAV